MESPYWIDAKSIKSKIKTELEALECVPRPESWISHNYENLPSSTQTSRTSHGVRYNCYFSSRKRNWNLLYPIRKYSPYNNQRKVLIGVTLCRVNTVTNFSSKSWPMQHVSKGKISLHKSVQLYLHYASQTEKANSTFASHQIRAFLLGSGINFKILISANILKNPLSQWINSSIHNIKNDSGRL